VSDADLRPPVTDVRLLVSCPPGCLALHSLLPLSYPVASSAPVSSWSAPLYPVYIDHLMCREPLSVLPSHQVSTSCFILCSRSSILLVLPSHQILTGYGPCLALQKHTLFEKTSTQIRDSTRAHNLSGSDVMGEPIILRIESIIRNRRY
jgi:hypothetical protein